MNKIIREKGKANVIIILLCTLALLVNVIWGGGNRFWIFMSGGGYLKDFGEASFETVFRQGEWWRLITGGYLHLGVVHLVANILALWCFGGIIESKLGTFRYIIVYHSAMIISTAVWTFVFQNSTMVGASAGIFSLYGVYLVWMKLKAGEGKPRLYGRNYNYFIGYAIGANVIWYSTTIIHAISFLVGMGLGMFMLKDWKRRNR